MDINLHSKDNSQCTSSYDNSMIEIFERHKEAIEAVVSQLELPSDEFAIVKGVISDIKCSSDDDYRKVIKLLQIPSDFVAGFSIPTYISEHQFVFNLEVRDPGISMRLKLCNNNKNITVNLVNL